ncbi:hypothetical protein BKA70DRAFT_1287572 [Coprinopsis sp. MPI-PUGE-AT-0042]|nr:hypothetical protein BKA70DRAFT_1287572 [Coprinopsis sp. MPI-PUGE-AT-0042]
MPSRKIAARAAMAPPLPENVTIRRYEERDRDEVCKLFWKGACVGDDSAMSIGLRNLHLQPISVVCYYLFATGIAIIYFQPSFSSYFEWFSSLLGWSSSSPAAGSTASSHTSSGQGGTTPWYLEPTYVGALLAFLTLATVVSIRWRFRRAIWASCKHAWQSDLSPSLGTYYAFNKEVGVASGGDGSETASGRRLGDEGGVSGFWVAEAVESVRTGKEEWGEKRVLVGCIGLDSRKREDKSVSEIRRFTVLPIEKYKHKGIGKALLYEAVSYARKHKNIASNASKTASSKAKNDNSKKDTTTSTGKKEVGLKKLVAIVSTYEPAAWGLLRAEGWKIESASATSTFVRKVYDYTMVLEL